MASFIVTGTYRLIINARDIDEADNYFRAQNYDVLDIEPDEMDYEIEPCDTGEY